MSICPLCPASLTAAFFLLLISLSLVDTTTSLSLLCTSLPSLPLSSLLLLSLCSALPPSPSASASASSSPKASLALSPLDWPSGGRPQLRRC
ncbi:hypothetical protein V8C42DRAFT_317537 [Trichoderma barbatum]